MSRAWYHPSDKAWLFQHLPQRFKEAFDWQPSSRLKPGHIWVEDDRDNKLKRFALPNAPPLRAWDTPPV